jgi:hypothetical protein
MNGHPVTVITLSPETMSSPTIVRFPLIMRLVSITMMVALTLPLSTQIGFPSSSVWHVAVSVGGSPVQFSEGTVKILHSMTGSKMHGEFVGRQQK